MRAAPFAMALAAAFAATTAAAEPPPVCTGYGLDSTQSRPLSPVTLPAPDAHCATGVRGGRPLPDPKCTPGAINPSATLAVLRDPRFRTACLRDKGSSPGEKEATYGLYALTKPKPNNGPNMVCELDHLISLELGGSDLTDNIWPQCGPADQPRSKRFFHQKDVVENYLAAEVEAGHISLKTAQDGIAQDWTQFIPAASRWHRSHPQKRQSDR